jgi:hypothetical protein
VHQLSKFKFDRLKKKKPVKYFGSLWKFEKANEIDHLRSLTLRLRETEPDLSEYSRFEKNQKSIRADINISL